MSDNKRYYWLKLNENFFEDDTIQWLEEQENGKDYVIFYLKLCLKSLSDDGKLIRYVGERLIPYDVKALGKLTNTSPDTVAVAMKSFLEIGLIERLDTGEIFMKQIDEMIGSETDSARRMRKKRLLDNKKQELLEGPSHCDNVVQKSDTEIEIELEKELDIELDIEIDIAQEKKVPSAELTNDFEELWSLFPNKKGKKKALSSYKTAIKNGTTNEQIKTGIENYKKHLESNKWLKPAHGSTWFSQERWNDEYDINTRSGGYDTSEYDNLF